MNFIDQMQKHSEEIERREQLKKIRVMLFSGIISYPLWGLLANWIAPGAYDPMWQRLAMSGLAAVLYGITFLEKVKQNKCDYYFIVCWLYTFHLLFLYSMNADIAFYLISNLIQFPYMVLTSPSKKSAQLYTYVQMIVAVFFSIFIQWQTLNPWLYTLGIITMGHFLLTLQIEKFNVLAQLKESHIQLALNARIASMFAIAGGVAHEINNPLGIIVARLQNLQKKINTESFDRNQATDIIQKTIKTSYRIAKIVTGLKALASPTDDYPVVSVSIKEIIQETLENFGEDYKKLNIRLILDQIPDVNITCKKIQIQQIIINLLENAVDAVSDVEDKWIRISFRNEKESISVAIYDSGVITSPETRQRMMEPFYTTKEVGKGVGLGLSISKAIVQSHHGELFLDTNSVNTCFIIRLKKS